MKLRIPASTTLLRLSVLLTLFGLVFMVWAMLEPTPMPSGEPMRDWRLAFADAVPALRRDLRGRA